MTMRIDRAALRDNQVEITDLLSHPRFGALFATAWSMWVNAHSTPEPGTTGVVIKGGCYEHTYSGRTCLIGAALLGQRTHYPATPRQYMCEEDIRAIYGLSQPEVAGLLHGFDGSTHTDLLTGTVAEEVLDPEARAFGARVRALTRRVWSMPAGLVQS